MRITTVLFGWNINKTILGTLAAGSGLAATVDFEAQSGFYDTSTPSSVFSGIVFDRDIQVLAGSSVAAGPGQSGQVARAATPPFGANPRGGNIGGMFDGFTVSLLSFVVGDSGGDLDIFRLRGFDTNGVEIADSGELGSRSAISVSILGTGISSFLLEIADLPFNDGSSVIDNVNFDIEVAAVPLPASLPLIGFGLLALGAVGRTRRKH